MRPEAAGAEPGAIQYSTSIRATAVVSHKQMIRTQASGHSLVRVDRFDSAEEFVMHLLRCFPYVKAARLAAGKNVLDLGCNIGYGTSILSEQAGRTVGADVSRRAVAAARKKFKRDNIEFKLLGSDHLPFFGGEFDLVTSFQVIEHVIDTGRYLNDIKRVLRPGGVALFTTPNSLIRLDPGMKPWNKFHVREYDPESFSALLGKYFSRVEIWGLFADEPLYSIDLNRVLRYREAARRKAADEAVQTRLSVPARILTGLKTRIPAPIRSWLKYRLVPSRSGGARPVNRGEGEFLFSERYRMESLFYRRDSLSTALDLLAVCADGRGALAGIDGVLLSRENR